MNAHQRFARLTTDVVVRRPRLWRLFRRPLARVFDGIAAEWEELRVTERYLAPLEAALEAVEPAPARVLDVGTGTGAAARRVASRWPDATIVGVDVSSKMIEEANARATPGTRFEVGDAASLPFEDGAFDLATLMNMIPFFDELARVLAPGGTVVIAFSRGRETPIYVPEERLRSGLEGAGFSQFAAFAAGDGTALLARRDDRS